MVETGRIIPPQQRKGAAIVDEIRVLTGFEHKFVPLDPPLTKAERLAREKFTMIQGNWRETHTSPTEGPHYRYQWLWDSCKAAVTNARRDDPDRADIELSTLMQRIRPENGFIPNKILESAQGIKLRDYPEAFSYPRPDIGSPYTQPPLEAWSAWEIYESYKRKGQEKVGKDFLQELYGIREPGNYTGLQGAYEYFVNERQMKFNDKLITLLNTNETGRDSGQENKPTIIFLPGTGKVSGAINGAVEAVRMHTEYQITGHRAKEKEKPKDERRVDWLPERVPKKYLFQDVMFNAFYVTNLRYMGKISTELGYEDTATLYETRAKEVEDEMLKRMWDPNDGFFYNLHKVDGKDAQIKVEASSGLFGLLLDGISNPQLRSLNEKLNDDTWFDTPYPIPTHATRSKSYDPHFKRKAFPSWSGPVWIDMNHALVEEGLVHQADRLLSKDGHTEEDVTLAGELMKTAGRVVKKTEELLAINKDVREFYDPETGRGFRARHFTWSNLGNHFEKYYTLAKKMGLEVTEE